MIEAGRTANIVDYEVNPASISFPIRYPFDTLPKPTISAKAHAPVRGIQSSWAHAGTRPSVDGNLRAT